MRALVSLLFLVAALSQAQAAVQVSSYLFQDSLNAQRAGSPPLTAANPSGNNRYLTDMVFGQSRTVYEVNGTASPKSAQGGLTYDAKDRVPRDNYSVELVVSVASGSTGWRRLYGCVNLARSEGLYLDPSGFIAYYSGVSSTGTDKLTAGVYYHIVMVKEPGKLLLYVNGALVASRTDGTALGVMDAAVNPDQLVQLFLDDSNEWVSSRIALFRSYSGPLTAQEVQTIYASPFTSTVGLPQEPTPAISSGGIVLANLLPTVNTVSPRSIISVFGQNFSTETVVFPNLDVEGKVATLLGGACLMMNGQPLPIFAVTPGQINAQVSAAQATGPMSFTVVTNCVTIQAVSSAPLLVEGPAPRELTSAVEMATLQEATPGFFIFDPVASNGFIAARFNATESQAPVPVAPASSFPNDSFGPSRPAKPGDIILLYGTGWGDTTAHLATGQLAPTAAEVLPEANRKITLGGVQLDPGDIFYVGVTPNTAGLYQAAVRIPANAQPGNQQVVLTVYGKSTPVGPVIPIAAP